MKPLSEYIIDEGLIQNIKKSLDQMSVNKYLNLVRKEIQNMHDSEYMQYYKEQDPETFAKKIEELNNNEDLTKILNMTKTIFNDKELNYSIGRELVIPSLGYPRATIGYLKKEYPNCNDDEIFAILQVLQAMAYAYCRDNRQLDPRTALNQTLQSGSSRSHSSVAATSASAAAVYMLRR